MSLILPFGVKVINPVPLDDKYMNGDTPYTGVSQVNSVIEEGIRHIGLTVNINNVEYWYKDGITDSDLVLKTNEGGSTGNTVSLETFTGYTASTNSRIDSLESLSGSTTGTSYTFENGLVNTDGVVSFGGQFNQDTWMYMQEYDLNVYSVDGGILLQSGNDSIRVDQNTNNGIRVKLNSGNTLHYHEDYSSAFTDLSIPHVGWVTGYTNSLLSGGTSGGSVNVSGSTNELLKYSDGSAVGSGLVSVASGTSVSIEAQGDGADIGLVLKQKGNTSILLDSGIFGDIQFRTNNGFRLTGIVDTQYITAGSDVHDDVNIALRGKGAGKIQIYSGSITGNSSLNRVLVIDPEDNNSIYYRELPTGATGTGLSGITGTSISSGQVAFLEDGILKGDNGMTFNGLTNTLDVDHVFTQQMLCVGDNNTLGLTDDGITYAKNSESTLADFNISAGNGIADSVNGQGLQFYAGHGYATGDNNGGSIYLHPGLKANNGKNGNIALFAHSVGAEFGDGEKVIYIASATTNPSSNPTKGGILYVDGADDLKLKYKAGSTTYDLTGSNANIVSITAATTLNASHAGKIIECSGTFTVTLPNSMPTGMQVSIMNVGSGTITVAASTTLQTKDGNNKLASQYGAASFYHSGSNVWRGFGDLTA